MDSCACPVAAIQEWALTRSPCPWVLHHRRGNRRGPRAGGAGFGQCPVGWSAAQTASREKHRQGWRRGWPARPGCGLGGERPAIPRDRSEQGDWQPNARQPVAVREVRGSIYLNDDICQPKAEALARHVGLSCASGGREARDPCSNACSNNADFAAARERSSSSKSLVTRRIRAWAKGGAPAAEVWGSTAKPRQFFHAGVPIHQRKPQPGLTINQTARAPLLPWSRRSCDPCTRSA